MSRVDEDAIAQLPIYRYERELLDAISNHQVVIVEGPTGSGKTTQLPRILLRAGIIDGIIGVTQPRRIAAVSVAWRIAEEARVELGQEVGYAIRFDDRTSGRTLIKVMTDGILLQEARTDSDFSEYGLVLVDEAHERSLNIDFVLGLLHRAVQRRDLKVVVSSATIQPEQFQRFFRDVAGDVPLVSIDARPFPVDIKYRAPASDHQSDVTEAAAREVMRIHREGGDGHVLVFMPGESAIRETIENIWDMKPGKRLETLPLFGRLTREEQERIFEDLPGKRKVVVATNIAETSITIEGVRHVIDSGLAKIPRVSSRTGIVALREEGISQASADQRAGRAGRTAPGECIRLYTPRDYANRPKFTDEEILRLDLSNVVLRLIDIGIRDLENFPFPTRPEPRKLGDALRLLENLGAIDGRRELTDVGKRMVPFPLSPQLARMVIEAADRWSDVMDEVLIVAAFLSAKSPFLYPAGEEQQARAAQNALANPFGDTLTAVETFRKYQDARSPKRFCDRNYLDPNTMGFIAKAHGQLVDIAKSIGLEIGRGGRPENIIRSVARGFVTNLMRAKGKLYEGPGDLTVAIHPSSALFGSRHRFVVAADIVVLKRPYAMHVSSLKPQWVAELDPSLARRWNIRQASRRKRELVDPTTVPKEITLGEVTLEIGWQRGSPRVQIPLEKVSGLVGASFHVLDKKVAAIRSRIYGDHHVFAQGTPLGLLIAQLPHMPLPEPWEVLQHDIPEGALLEHDRNAHTLARYFDHIMRPTLPERGKMPGWVTLVANGGGGYWYEVDSDLHDAVRTNVESLEDLLATIPASDPLDARARVKVEELRHTLDALDMAKADYKDYVRGR